MMTSSWENRRISSSGQNSHPQKKTREITPHQRSMIWKTLRTVSRSPFPQYWEPRMDAAAIAALRNMVWTNWICVARETAVISFWATPPSISASAAATDASIRLWNEMGVASFLSRV